jgi:hypothetical protein
VRNRDWRRATKPPVYPSICHAYTPAEGFRQVVFDSENPVANQRFNISRPGQQNVKAEAVEIGGIDG